ncbi:hypothetical protein GQ473_06095 [archaeon]|nr:hypothetical protein [archaeon]
MKDEIKIKKIEALLKRFIKREKDLPKVDFKYKLLYKLLISEAFKIVDC